MRISFIIVSLFLLSGCGTLDYVSVSGHSGNYNSHYRISHYSHYNYFGYDHPYYSPYVGYRYYTIRPYVFGHHSIMHLRPIKRHDFKKNHQLRDRRKHDSNTPRPRRP